MKKLSRTVQYFHERRLLVATVGAVIIALIMTAVSIRIYESSDVSRLDLSRPGHEKTRSKVVSNDEYAKFDSTGPIDASSIETFQKLYSKNRTELGVLGKFDSNVLDADQLKIKTNE